MTTYTTVAKKLSDYRSNLANTDIQFKEDVFQYKERMNWWRGDVSVTFNGPEFLQLSRDGSIRGTVKVGPTPVPYAPVFLYWRPTGILLDRATCDSSGFFRFDGFDKNSNDYFVVAVDAPYNAQIFDKIVPLT